MFVDEAGFYLLPAVVRSYAPCGEPSGVTSQIDFAHAAATDFLEDFVVAELRADQGVAWRAGEQRGSQMREVLIEEIGRQAMSSEQGFDFVA